MGAQGHLQHTDPHRKLNYDLGQFLFESGSRPKIVFTEDEIRIGCKTISRKAFEELQRRYTEFLNPKKREEIIQY